VGAGGCRVHRVVHSAETEHLRGRPNVPRALISILGSYVFWLWTPRILLGPRVAWHRLLPIAGLTTVAVTILALASPLYMPTMIRDDAARFGAIGAAFALLSGLVVLAFLVVGSAVAASQFDRDRALAPDAPGAASTHAAERSAGDAD
jgi:uncharacterized BrkB/YihY/UPF0761 family membrane protein